MNELSISEQYPVGEYNLLGNTSVMASIPDIKSPVVQVVQLDPTPGKGDVYVHQKAKDGYKDSRNVYHPPTPALYAITKNGLKKLADGAGIKMVSSEHVLPATCQKCVEVNRSAGSVVQCGNCKNRDIAFRVTISVPQLTGEVLMVSDTNEIIAENHTASMSVAQKAEFLKFMPQICEAKALNGAIRTALHLKGTYTKEELQRPFVVAYLVPNLDNEEVKEAAIKNMFESTGRLFGTASTPSVQQIETSAPDAEVVPDDADIDKYVDGTYTQCEEATEENGVVPPDPVQERNDFYCDKCGNSIEERVWDYSMEHFERPLCRKCQNIIRRGAR